MRKKVFILGVGAQKAGTTWLHSQLSKCENVDMGFAKEYHVFDVIYSEHCAQFRRRLLDGMAGRIRKGSIGDGRNANMSKRLSFVDNTDNYFDYFDYLHARNQAVEAVGDITPSYSMLSANAFAHMKHGLERRGFSVKVVFLMRDPVERIWSMLRMKHRVRRERFDLTDGSAAFHQRNEDDELRELYKAPESQLRTRYERTIHELEKVFDRSQIHYEFYESLFCETSFASLGKFLELDLQEPDFAFRTNVSEKKGVIDLVLNREIANFHARTYRQVQEYFGKWPREIWQGYAYLNA